jgi:integrase
VASFEVRGDSVRAIVRLPGTKKKQTETFDTEGEARAWASEFEAAIKGRGKTKGQLLSLGKSVRELFDLYLTAEGDLSDGARWNRVRLSRMSKHRLAQMQVSDVRPHDINCWIVERLNTVSAQTGQTIAPSTVNRELNLLSSVFRYAVKALQWLETNPCHGVNRPAENSARNRPLLTADEIAAIRQASGYEEDPGLRTATSRVGAAFLFALETGMRSGEILRIRPQDINLEASVVRVSATERGGRKSTNSGRIRGRIGRDVPLTPRACQIIRQLMENIPKDQPKRDGQEFPPYLLGLSDAIRDALWRQIRDRSGVANLTFHDSKHEACTRLSKYIDVMALSHAVGTKDLKLLRDTYYQHDAATLALALPQSLMES